MCECACLVDHFGARDECTHASCHVLSSVRSPQSLQIPGCDSACCKMMMTFGADWSVLDVRSRFTPQRLAQRRKTRCNPADS